MWHTLLDFAKDYCEFLPAEIPVLYSVPTPIEFFRNYVSASLPFIVRNSIEHWPALKKWDSNSYLRNQMKGRLVTVAVTPNGYADAIIDDKFMLPEERTMPFCDFLDGIESNRPEVFYLQKQNNCLIDEFSPLVDDVACHVSWATEAFGSLPEAANFWMGDERSVTSMHKDNYENIYCVIRGKKTFTLYPPAAVAWMPYKKCKMFQYYSEDGNFKIRDLNNEIKWIPSNKRPEIAEKIQVYEHTTNYQVDVESGDVLYLPALWFHEVEQSKGCIAVNYWYDMKYDMKYPYFCLLEKLGLLSVSPDHTGSEVNTT